MEVLNCERCGRTYVRSTPSQAVCKRCEQAEEEEFVRVKEYLLRRPGAGADELADKLDIPHKTIIRFMQSGRLSSIGIRATTCSSCGKPIERGTMCESCQNLLLRELRSVRGPTTSEVKQQEAQTRQSGARFHTQKK